MVLRVKHSLLPVLFVCVSYDSYPILDWTSGLRLSNKKEISIQSEKVETEVKLKSRNKNYETLMVKIAPHMHIHAISQCNQPSAFLELINPNIKGV